MAAGIFLLHDDGGLREMREQQYASEDLLQDLLAKYPTLLAGDQIDAAKPRKWLLVSREMAVPGDESGAGRWSLDHLFLDQDGVPTLVEVKRSSDTRARREVVAQMLDYAANADAFWSVERIQSCFERTCQSRSREPDAELSELLGPDGDVAQFWQAVKTNLEARRLRLLFVADAISPELRRIIEFLNEQMRSAEILGVEIKQFVGEGVKSLVPRVIGQTAMAEDQKRGAVRRTRWELDSFLSALEDRNGQDARRVAESVLQWADANGLAIKWGAGADGSFAPSLLHRGYDYTVFAVYSYGSVEMRFEYLAAREPFDNDSLRRELFDRVNSLGAIDWPSTKMRSRPSFKMGLIAEDQGRRAFLATMKWAFDKIRAS